jgi:NhaA family Na+:H+ antiporter
MLVGKNIPPAIKIFLLAIAIFDDLGAILIIAAFYNTELALMPLLLAGFGLGILGLLNWRNVTVLTPYFLTGIFLWFCFYHSGIHTTVAGVAVGMAIPMRDKDHPRHSPLNICMHFLHPWVSFLVLPIFAFTSAGVSFAGMQTADLLKPLPLGIALGLFFGKQIGIFGTTWLLVTMRLASKPEGASWMHLYGVSIIAGIGFTMSLFIGLLAFDDAHMQEMVKIGVIGGSLLSTLGGFIVLRYLTREKSIT